MSFELSSRKILQIVGCEQEIRPIASNKKQCSKCFLRRIILFQSADALQFPETLHASSKVNLFLANYFYQNESPSFLRIINIITA